MRDITVAITATMHIDVQVPDDASPEQITAAVVHEVPKYPDLKAGVHFDPEEYVIVEDSASGSMDYHNVMAVWGPRRPLAPHTPVEVRTDLHVPLG